MATDIKNIKSISELAALFIKEEELMSYAKELDLVIEYMNELKELDTGEVKPMEHVLLLSNVFREDIITNSDNRDVLMKNATITENGYYKVPMLVESI